MAAGNNLYKVTWTFQDLNGAGWQEVYYASGNAATDLVQPSTKMTNARLALLNPTNQLVRIRVSNVTGNRDTAQRTYQLAGTAKSQSGNPAPPDYAAVCQFYGLAGGQRKLWLRGVPGEWIGRNITTGASTFGGEISGYFPAFANALANEGYGIRFLTQGTAKYQIASVDGSSGNGMALVTYVVGQGQTAPTWTANSRIIIGSADKKTLPGLNGHYSVLSSAGLTVTLRYVVAKNQLITQNCGTIKSETYAGLSVINNKTAQLLYWGQHDTKNPIGPSRGARRAPRIRSLA